MRTRIITTFSIKGENNRDSNLEALRILSMFMIVCHHIIVHGLGVFNAIDGSMATTAILTSIESFFIYGVNIFILISGYYGIKLSIRKFIYLCLLVSLYMVLNTVLTFFSTGHIEFRQIINIFLPVSAAPGWFIFNYFILMLVSPVINKFVDFASKSEYSRQILIFIFMLCYLGFVRRHFNGGYDIWNFILLYLVARYIHVYNLFVNTSPKKSIGVYVLCSILIGGIALYMNYLNHPSLSYRILWYNSPLVLTGSLGLFILFRNMKFRNSLVNWIASSVFSVYLVQEGAGLIWSGEYMYNRIGEMFLSHSLITFAAFIIVYIICLFVTAIVLDKLFKIIISYIIEPVTHILKAVIDKTYRITSSIVGIDLP